MDDRIWLDVPYSEKDQAKALGAKWNPHARRWYAPAGTESRLRVWLPKPALPTTLPGEDRTYGTGLFVDLVPSSCWFTNVRKFVTAGDWDRLRHMVYTRAGNRCEVCGAGQDKERHVWLEAHERWHYDDQRQVQILRRLVALCSPCHESTHIGFAKVKGNDDRARAHLATVNGWTTAQAEKHIVQAFGRWKERSRIEWTLDLSMLTDAGIRLEPPPSATARRDEAERSLRNAQATDPSDRGWPPASF